MKQFLMVSAAVLMAVLAGCTSPTDDVQFSDQLVVNAYLLGGQPIDSIYVQRTVRLTERLTDENSAVRNATVIISGNNMSDTLAADPARPGRYASKYRNRLVQPGASYSLLIKVPGYGDVTGTTSVPDTFSILNSADIAPTVRYLPTTAPLRLEWTKGGNFADVMFVVRSLEPESAMIPMSFHDEENKPDRTAIGFFLRDVNASSVSWLYFNYYGRTQITLVATDQNYFDYLKQFVTAQGASDLKEMRFNLNGAIGVFGSETIANHPVEVTIIP